MENEIENLAVQIADTVFPHVSDQQRRDNLFRLLMQFGEEIKRQAVEP